MPPRIFINYRREDASGHAGRLYDALAGRFGRESVFMDVDTLRPGENFANVLDDRVASCDFLIALIGRRWLSVADREGRRRLERPVDYVRLELQTALTTPADARDPHARAGSGHADVRRAARADASARPAPGDRAQRRALAQRRRRPHAPPRRPPAGGRGRLPARTTAAEDPRSPRARRSHPRRGCGTRRARGDARHPAGRPRRRLRRASPREA